MILLFNFVLSVLILSIFGIGALLILMLDDMGREVGNKLSRHN